MFTQFLEPDIEDLFKIFIDRFRVRQILKKLRAADDERSFRAHPESAASVSNSAASITSADVSTDDNEEDAKKSSVCTTTGPCKYSVDDMLSKKQTRGKPSEAQTFFAGIIKDAAKSAKIWKKAPLLLEISEPKKQHFFNTMMTVCPELTHHRQAVWENLRKRLANRRKYLLDKSKGKRNSNTSMSQTYQDKSASVQQSSKFSAGENVSIKSSSGNILGQGMYLRNTSDLYAEITVKSINRKNIGECDELPQKSGQASHFRDVKEKQMILWRITRLHASTLASTSTSVSTDEQPKQKVKSKSKPATSEVEKLSKPMDKYLKPREVLVLKDVETVQTSNTGKSQVSSLHVSCEKSVVLMEWSGGKVFLGLLEGSDKNEHITSCSSPVAKIYGDKFVLAKNDLGKGLKLNKSDVERRPNKEFLIWSIPRTVCSMKEDGRELVLHVSAEEFFININSKLEIYMQS